MNKCTKSSESVLRIFNGMRKYSKSFNSVQKCDWHFFNSVTSKRAKLRGGVKLALRDYIVAVQKMFLVIEPCPRS